LWIQDIFERDRIDTGGVHCWTSFEQYFQITPCTFASLSASLLGKPLVCETDICHAIMCRLAWAMMMANYYGNPENQLTIIGVTGTDGKTTTTNLIYNFLKAAGTKVSMVSTIKAIIGGREFDTGLHTSSPDPARHENGWRSGWSRCSAVRT